MLLRPEGAGAPLGGLESSHVHSMAMNPADQMLLAAPHEGLFELRDRGAVLVGPVIDLMSSPLSGLITSGHLGTQGRARTCRTRSD